MTSWSLVPVHSHFPYLCVLSIFRTIAIRTGPSSGITVSVKRPHKYTNSLPGFLTDKKWGLVGGSFKEVAWDKVPGRTFVQRFFLLLGVETTP